MAVAEATSVTTEELLALPQDGVERWLIRGQLRERPMTVRNRWHSRIMARVSQILNNWLDQQPEPRGAIMCGGAPCRLRRDPDTTFGMDAVYVSAELAAPELNRSPLIDGAPRLTALILSPKDTERYVNERIAELRSAGVALVWVIDPHDRTVLIYRPGTEPELVNVRQELSGEPPLPGFRVAAAQLFA